MVITQGLRTGFSHRLQAGKMDAALDFVFLKYPFQRRAVKKIDLIKRRSLAGDRLNAIQYTRLTVGKVIHDNDILTRIQKFNHGMRTDKAGSTCNQYRHAQHPFFI